MLRRPNTAPSSCIRGTMSASSATRSPSGCSISAGWKRIIHARYPQHELVFRNLGYSGDEINGYRELYSRMRSMDFGSQDQWLAGEAPIPQPRKLNKDAPVSANRFRLTNTRADVVFVFYGYNESFAGAAGSRPIQGRSGPFHRTHAGPTLQRQNCSPARAVLAHRTGEPAATQTCPTAWRITGVWSSTRTRWLRWPSRTGVFFVDLFTPSREFFSQSPHDHWTINGIHLTEEGDRVVAGMAYAASSVSRRRLTRRTSQPTARSRQRKELVLVQSLPHDRRLFDLRRPGLFAVRQRTDELRSRAARTGDDRPADLQPRQGRLGGR